MKTNIFKWKHFEKDIILLCVRWYLKYPLSYRNLIEMMYERGINVSHTTIMRWVHQYSPIMEERIRKYVKQTNDSWRMDETYIKIKGKNAYLYRAVDSSGKTIDFMVSEQRDKKAARKFFRKALKAEYNQSPRVITTDRYPATEMAILEERYYGDISCRTEHRMCKYLNNIVEQDHRFIKKKIKLMLGFKTLESTEKTIAGIEIMHMIKKGQVRGISCVNSEVQFIGQIMN
ncbi:MAG: IS6 family transposase [Clostridiales bacterium]|nr:IS6 family transposase [Clostridiales bacterium]